MPTLNQLHSLKFPEQVSFTKNLKPDVIEPKHAFVGMFLSLAALAGGDFDKLKTEWKSGAPFVSLDVDGYSSSATLIYESFVNYATTL